MGEISIKVEAEKLDYMQNFRRTTPPKLLATIGDNCIPCAHERSEIAVIQVLQAKGYLSIKDHGNYFEYIISIPKVNK
jgi:hypothetical protein